MNENLKKNNRGEKISHIPLTILGKQITCTLWVCRSANFWPRFSVMTVKKNKNSNYISGGRNGKEILGSLFSQANPLWMGEEGRPIKGCDKSEVTGRSCSGQDASSKPSAVLRDSSLWACKWSLKNSGPGEKISSRSWFRDRRYTGCSQVGGSPKWWAFPAAKRNSGQLWSGRGLRNQGIERPMWPFP